MKVQNTADALQILGAVFVVFGIIFIAIGAGRLMSYAFIGAGAVLPIISLVVRRRRR